MCSEQSRDTEEDAELRDRESSSMMKSIVCLSVLITVLSQLCGAVTVTEGDFQFSLESVKALGVLMNRDTDPSAVQELLKAAAVCSNPDLPKDFKPLCARKDAAESLARLALIASHPDTCEICEYVACTGC